MITRDRKWVLVGVSVLLGVGLSLLLFFPVLGDVFSNRFVESTTPFSIKHLSSKLPWIMTDMIGGRYVILALALVGVVLVFVRSTAERYLVGWLLGLIFLPFVISFVRGDLPFMRSFVPMAVPLALVMALGVHHLLNGIPRLKGARFPVLLLLGLEGWFAFQNNWEESEAECLYNIEHVHHAEDLGTCYFQHRYQPLEDVRNFVAMEPNVTDRILIHRCQPHDIRFYLELYDLPSHRPHFDTLRLEGGQFYAVTENPNELVDVIAKMDSSWNARILNPQLTYHTFISFSREAE